MAGGIHDAEDSWAEHGIKPGHPAYNALVLGRARVTAPSLMDTLFEAAAPSGWLLNYPKVARIAPARVSR